MFRPGAVAIDLDKLVAGEVHRPLEPRQPALKPFDEPVDPAAVAAVIVDRIGVVA
jgi:hypothetical protein